MWFIVFCALVVSAVIDGGDRGAALIEPIPEAAFSGLTQFPDARCYYGKARRTSSNGWCASSNTNSKDYLQVDLGEEYEIESVSTYARVDAPGQFVKTYKLSYSLDGASYSDYKETLNGNQKSNTGNDAEDEVNNKLDPPIDARYLRFTPITFNQHKSMRVEAYGSDVAKVSCDAFEIDEFLSSCSDLFESNVDGLRTLQGEINDVNKRLDDVIKNVGDEWKNQDLSSSSAQYAMPGGPDFDDDVIDDGKKHENEIKKWFNNYRDNLIVLSLVLNILVIGYIVYMSINEKKKYQHYAKVKYVDSSENENAAFNM